MDSESSARVLVPLRTSQGAPSVQLPHCVSKFVALLHAGRQVVQLTRCDFFTLLMVCGALLTSWGVLCNLLWCRDEAVALCCKLIWRRTQVVRLQGTGQVCVCVYVCVNSSVPCVLLHMRVMSLLWTFLLCLYPTSEVGFGCCHQSMFILCSVFCPVILCTQDFVILDIQANRSRITILH